MLEHEELCLRVDGCPAPRRANPGGADLDAAMCRHGVSEPSAADDLAGRDVNRGEGNGDTCRLVPQCSLDALAHALWRQLPFSPRGHEAVEMLQAERLQPNVRAFQCDRTEIHDCLALGESFRFLTRSAAGRSVRTR